VYEREDGLKSIRIHDVKSEEEHLVRFPEPAYTIWPADNPEFDTDLLRFNYTSLVTPRSVIDYNMDTREQKVLKRYEVNGGYNPEEYETQRIFAAAHDGTKIPITLVHRKGLKRNGGNPLFLYGYGSYGASIEPYFVANRLSLIDRGMVYAIAHVRGGGEMGRHWYDQGKLLSKRNTFTDFIACAEHLIDRGYTSAGRIACYGGSAGGLLVGVAVNMRPDLWGAVIAHVPFVDVLNTMLDESIPLTVIEYEEWGNPSDKKFYEYIRSYSPYDNLKPQYYPPIFVTGGLNDPRVQYWEPAKWTARMRAIKVDDNPLLLRTKMSEGHSGASGRYDYLRDVALDYAFILDCFGVTE
jgi:oligopeptidase B